MSILSFPSEYPGTRINGGAGTAPAHSGRGEPKPQPFMESTSHKSPRYRKYEIMRKLTEDYFFSPNAAAAIVGNLWIESNLIPNAVERSDGRPPGDRPMYEKGFDGRYKHFTADEIMLRGNDFTDASGKKMKIGPRMPGVGLAQWTWKPRRKGLFQHPYQGKALGSDVLFSVEAQLNYLDWELNTKEFKGLQQKLRDPGLTAEEASYEFARKFLKPDAIINHKPDSEIHKKAASARKSAAKEVLDIYETIEKARTAPPLTDLERGDSGIDR